MGLFKENNYYHMADCFWTQFKWHVIKISILPQFNKVPKDLENWFRSLNRGFVILRFVYHIFYFDFISLD